jgi:hypothetical protein
VINAQLDVEHLDQLADGIVQMLKRGRALFFLIGPWDRFQGNLVFLPPFCDIVRAGVGLVTQNLQVGMPIQRFKANLHIQAIGLSQLKIIISGLICRSALRPIATNDILITPFKDLNLTCEISELD